LTGGEIICASKKDFSVRIQPGGWEFETGGTRTVLEAAGLADLLLPSSCRNGTCRTCICRLVDGSVGYRIEWPGLSAEEKSDGFILSCVAYPESNLVIDVPGAARRVSVTDGDDQ
jgi:ferredoxin